MNKFLLDIKQLSELTELSNLTPYSSINQKRIPYVKVGEGLFGLNQRKLRNRSREIAWNRRICREKPPIGLGLLCKRMLTNRLG
ncbi:hypothetical protein CEE34_04635 [Candidatus Aerophobetes bacterium Ae_b3a]|nr:MAG: hypothetical protein CEE34_04635 [Candidatus Aerophobetes bacterium Ae_b3a]